MNCREFLSIIILICIILVVNVYIMGIKVGKYSTTNPEHYQQS